MTDVNKSNVYTTNARMLKVYHIFYKDTYLDKGISAIFCGICHLPENWFIAYIVERIREILDLHFLK